MARPRRYGERKSTGIRFDPELLERLQTQAELRDVSVNLLVNRGAQMLLDALEAPNQGDVLTPRLVVKTAAVKPVGAENSDL
jgi:hypothetical protein